jgi:polyhydroxyalkanoate synthesis regulator phasin
MASFIKNTIYTSIGVVAITNEKLKELIEDLIQNNHYTKDEGMRITDDFLFNLREQVDQANGTIQVSIDRILKKYGFNSLFNLKDEVEKYVKDIKDNPAILMKLPTKK